MRAFSALLLALLVHGCSGHAMAQTQHNHGSGTARLDPHIRPYQQQVPVYPTIPTPNTSAPGELFDVDPSTTWLPKLGTGTYLIPGGNPAAFAWEPPNIPSNFNVGAWSVTGYNKSAAGGEAKFRTHCNYSHHAYEDPIIYPGQKKVSHLHTFFGNNTMNGNSTYEQLRKSYNTVVDGRVGTSTCAGGPINNSGYWYPAVLKDNAIGDGRTMIVKPGVAVVYYNIQTVNSDRTIRIPRGLNFVFGVRPDDVTNSIRIAEVNAANTASNAAGGRSSYIVPDAYDGAGFAGWHCVNDVTPYNGNYVNSPRAGQYQPYLRNLDGTATLDCPSTATSYMVASVSGQTCWDGVNLTSPNGRDHMRYLLTENNTSKSMCPMGWYQIVAFELSVYFKHEGSADYKEWYLSSDRMVPGSPLLNGQSFHSDWFGAWDYDIMQTWMQKCNGTNLVIGGTDGDPGDCGDTRFGDAAGTGGKVGSAPPDGSRAMTVNVDPAQYTGNARFDPMP